jgi:hypothetical protein
MSEITTSQMLFTAPMIRAKRAGMKTQTRRLVKGLPHHWQFLKLVDGVGYFFNPGFAGEGHIACPYGKPGDLIYVKETFWAWGRWETRYNPKKGRDEWHFIDMTLECGHSYFYDADQPDNAPRIKVGRGSAHNWWRRPAIFMPRIASRLTLTVADIRVERLQECSNADAIAEGIGTPLDARYAAAHEYRALWESINGPGSWAANPWVWAITFEVINQNVDAVLATLKAAS